MKKKLKLVCISDTHSRHESLDIPEGDILIHAGDLSKQGSQAEISEFNHWLGTLPHKHKILIAGNHDFLFEERPSFARGLVTNAIYLEDSGTEIENTRFWGSPVSPRFLDWAFNRDRGSDISRHWKMIPEGTDVLITHSPPLNILDKTHRGLHVGCADLYKTVLKIRPKIVIFGHIHEDHGIIEHEGITFINASILDERYKPAHNPLLIEI